MAVRTTGTLVKEIIETTLTSTQIDPFILGANAMVTDVLGTSSISESTLAEIERWISAHLVCVTKERLAKKEGAGGASIEYAGDFGSGLSSTSYGQTAIALDYTGALSRLSDGRKKARVYAIPTVIG